MHNLNNKALRGIGPTKGSNQDTQFQISDQDPHGPGNSSQILEAQSVSFTVLHFLLISTSCHKSNNFPPRNRYTLLFLVS